MHNIWIADDDEAIRLVLEESLSSAGFKTKSFNSADDLLKNLDKEQPDLIITDVQMPGMLGYDLLKHINNNYENIPVIVMTAFADMQAAVESFGGGAFEYIPKPFDLEEATEIINRALEDKPKTKGLKTENKLDIIGESQAMQDVFRAIGKLSSTIATVLIQGESGTGKELIAKSLHKNSPRYDMPFIALNMADIPKELVESELFGHEKGAFTSAHQRRIGRFEQADGGTLFLDEIGETPVSCQIKLLRTIESGEFYPVGASRPRSSQFRLVTATNRSAELLRGSEHFRSDFFYRIATIQIHVPPLRERREDIPQLAEFFLRQCSPEQTRSLSPAALDELQQRSYPGNVRELKNLIIGAAAQSTETIIGPGALQQTVEVAAESDRSPEQQLISAAGAWATAQISTDDESIVHSALELVEPELIRAALKHCKGNRSAAAQRLGIHRETLREKMGRYGIEVE